MNLLYCTHFGTALPQRVTSIFFCIPTVYSDVTGNIYGCEITNFWVDSLEPIRFVSKNVL